MRDSSLLSGARKFPAGKIASAAFERIIEPHLGRHRPEVLVGPRNGVDTGIVDLGGGQVMALTTDPFFVMPEYGWKRAAWFAMHIVASDAWTTGIEPRYCTIDLNLPPTMSDDELENLWTAVDSTCRDIGLAVVTGHTGRYDGCAYPMLGAATVISVGEHTAYLTPEMAGVGDAVIITKGAAIETTGMFGATFPHQLEARLGAEIAGRAEALFESMSVVADCRAAVSVGIRDRGITTLHDATERGIWGGLVEIARASGVGLLIDQDAILLAPEVRAVCDLVGIDPFSSSSEGTLLLTCRPGVVASVIQRLDDLGIRASHVGEVTPAEGGTRVVRAGRTEQLTIPTLDPFWPAFRRALDEWEA